MSTILSDLTLPGISNCCGAKVYIPDICSDCKEHCEAVSEKQAHIEAVANGDIDPDNCATCREKGMEGYEASHDL